MSCCVQPKQLIKQSHKFNIEYALSTVVRVFNKQTENMGTATCIYKETVNDILNLYFLTVSHVVYQTDQLQLGFMAVESLRSDEQIEMQITCWKYDKRGHSVYSETHDCFGFHINHETDVAILKLSTKKPTELLLNMQTVPLATSDEYQKLKVGDKVVYLGCPYGLPVVYLPGYITRLSYKHQNREKCTKLFFVNIDVAGGSSGSAIIYTSNGKIIGLVQSTWYPGGFIVGVIPIDIIITELEQTMIGLLM
jgi:S1-C subfamily serine protease